MYQINDRIMTKYGPGTIVHFEHIGSVSKPVAITTEYAAGDRIGVSLDYPGNWVLSCTTDSLPYFMTSDISEYIINL